MKRFIRWAAWLYPAEWRRRYGGEFEVLLDDARLQWSDVADVIRGAAIVHITSGWMSYWKMALLAGTVGAMLAGAVAFTIHDQYVCAAAVAVERPGATPRQLVQPLAEAIRKILGRDGLIALMTDPQLDLYRAERQRHSADDVAEGVFRKHVHVQRYNSVAAPNEQAFRIWFEYPDRFKAKAVVDRLTEAFQQQVARNPDGPAITVLENPVLPEKPIYPVRGSIALVGSMAGMLVGLLSLKIWRRTGTYAVVTMSIPKEIKRFVDSRVVAGPYRDVSEYIRALIRADEEQHK